MNVLIVYAHPEPQSFNGAMKDLAVQTLTEAGHQVTVSDLYAMNFDPVGGRADFTRPSNPAYFDYILEQREAHRAGTFAPDILAEQHKLSQAELVIFQFPVWWRSMPAMLKGWVDRVISVDFAYGGGKYYETGGLQGRRAMLAVTASGELTGEEANQWLYHTLDGVLAFTGLAVLPTYVAAPRSASPEERARMLEGYRERLLALDTTPTLTPQAPWELEPTGA